MNQAGELGGEPEKEEGCGSTSCTVLVCVYIPRCHSITSSVCKCRNISRAGEPNNMSMWCSGSLLLGFLCCFWVSCCADLEHGAAGVRRGGMRLEQPGAMLRPEQVWSWPTALRKGLSASCFGREWSAGIMAC